ncbi:MAG: taurine dioxygenase [Alphaproteobacteria bacterium]|nr:taurine dioxygenase [Alphaproteobacteria bacterium]
MEIRPLSGSGGAEILGVDIARGLSNAIFADIHRAFLDYGVIFFRDQPFDLDAQVAFARHFGDIDQHPIVKGMEDRPDVIKIHKRAGESATFGVGWHSDNSYMVEPSLGSVLYGDVIPPFGGDTVFAFQTRAYERLSSGMKKLLDGLVAIHGAGPAFSAPTTKEKWEGKSTLAYQMSDAMSAEVEHPVVRTHPETGRKALYVNPMFTLRLKDMTEAEARPLLEFLYVHAAREEFTCRFRWTKGAIAVWDNRAVMHNALDDYEAYERVMYRVTVKGDKPR